MKDKNQGFSRFFDLVDVYGKAGQDSKSVEVLQVIKDRMYADGKQNDFIAQLDSVGGKHSNSQAILEYCGKFYNEANRETQYFEILIKLFDVYLNAGNVEKASDALEKLLDIDPYDHRNQERLQKLHGRVDESILKRLGARLSKSGTAGPPRSVNTRSSTADSVSTPASVGSDARHMQALEDLIVQTEIFLQYSRALAVFGAPGRPPEMAAEFCAAGIRATPGAQVVLLLAQMEKAQPDELGGLTLKATEGSILKGMGIATALGVSINDKETQSPAGMLIVGHAEAYKWKPNEAYFLQAIGDQMLMSVSPTRLRSLVRRMGVSDERTGLLSRSSYQNCLLTEADRSRTQGTPLSLAILHIDRGAEILRQQGESPVERFLEQLAPSLQPIVRQNYLAVKHTSC